MTLQETDVLPPAFLDCGPTDLHALFPAPTLISLNGRAEPPLFVSTMLHGNETTSLFAVQRLLKKYGEAPLSLPRSLILFVGNPAAAAAGKRRLTDQVDYNRIWSGGAGSEHRLAQRVLKRLAEGALFASVDIHNNTGKNPHYGCITTCDNRHLHLAKEFSRQIVYFTEPPEVLSKAMSALCPSITLECGHIGDRRGAEHACDYLETLLHQPAIPDTPVRGSEIDIYHTTASVRVPRGKSISFLSRSGDWDFRFVPGLERLNFTEVLPGETIGWVRDSSLRLEVIREGEMTSGSDVFSYRGLGISAKRRFIPSMLTTNVEVIAQDCLCYLMERWQID